MEAQALHAALRQGFALLRAGEAFAAHEVWEAAWLQLARSDPRRRPLQGLIQLAAAVVKGAQGRSRGVDKLTSAALARLDVAGHVWPGPAWEPWQAWLRAWRAVSPPPLRPPPWPAGGPDLDVGPVPRVS